MGPELGSGANSTNRSPVFEVRTASLPFTNWALALVLKATSVNTMGRVVYSSERLNGNAVPLNFLFPGLYYVSYQVEGRPYQQAFYHR